MKFFFDLFPVILFFITLKIAEKSASASLVLSKIMTTLGIAVAVKPDLVPIMLATVAVVVGTVIQIVWARIVYKKIDAALWVSGLIVTLLGGMTLYFQDATFIKWKPTALYWIFSLVLFLADKMFKKNVIKTMMGKEIELPEGIWANLNLAWALFFLILGFLNLYIAFHFSIDTWANFKLFGTMGLMFVFIIAQSLLLNKYIVLKEKE